ncbi:MAG TPA: penicillin-binding protein 1A [Xanthomonadaceae bacterium]|nr:penicillin-binding protein 1A [Xanthomonadaceae bacterium]
MATFRRLLRWGLLAFVGLFLLGAIAAATLYYTVSSKLPDVQSLRNVELQEPLYVYARDGRLMALFGEIRRYPVRFAQIPVRMRQAFIAIEDNRFYEHGGVDYKGTARAIWLVAKTGSKRGVPGGSTITQQLARQFFLSSEVSYSRKLAEMLLAMKMERELSKDEIFELYLNNSFFGNRAYGVNAAAEFYYGKPLAQLSLDEIATLAAIPKFPSSGNPLSNPERARIRRDYVLQRMRELGFIGAPEERAAQAVTVSAAPHERPVEVYAPYVAEMVRQEMIARYGKEALTRGYHVVTTIDPALQIAADAAVREGLRIYDHRHGWNKIEQHFDLRDDEPTADIAARLRGIPTQAGLMPAIVKATARDGSATVVFAGGEDVVLPSSASRWTGRSPAGLFKRGDLARLRLQPSKQDLGDKKQDADKPGKSPAQATAQAADTPAEKPVYIVDQLPRAQSTLISLEYETGALRALIGGYSYAGNKFNRATQARRQPGSSFKPFVYAAAFERGFNPTSVVLDAPVVFRDRRGKMWRPQNDSGNFLGPMRLREALVQSRNLVSVRLLDAIGVEYARKFISHFGIDLELLPPNLSMSLGTASLPPLQVARGYAAFANGGFRITPWFIDSVRDRNGVIVHKENPPTACRSCPQRSQERAVSNVVDGFDFSPGGPAVAATADKAGTGAKGSKDEVKPAPAPDPNMVLAPRAIDERVAFQLTSMMRDVVQRGTGTAAKVLKREDIGGKTGSTNDHRDAWFSGTGGNLVTTVWVGRDDFRTLGHREYGGKAALPIWIDFMRVALKDQPIATLEPPDGMIKVSVGGGGLGEYVKAEDLERMETAVSYGPRPAKAAQPAEESFDIF